MRFAVFLFTLSLSFDIHLGWALQYSFFTLSLSVGIGNENHISVLNMITKYDMVVASCVGHVILKSCVIEYCMYVIKIRP